MLLLCASALVPIVVAEGCQGENTDTTTGGPSAGPGIMVTAGNTGGSGPGPTTSAGGTGGDGGMTGPGPGPGPGSGGFGGSAGGAGGAGGSAGTVVLHETFDDENKLVKADSVGASIDFFSDGVDDYLGISDGAAGGLWNGDAAPNVEPYTGFSGNFLAAQDLDGEGGDEHVRIEWLGLDVNGLSGLTFSVALAENGGDIDTTDFVSVEVQLDAGGYTKILEFRGTGANGVFGEDTNLDGSADGTNLATSAAVFSKPIVGSGAVLDVRLSIRLDAGNEDIGVDDVRVTAP